MTANDARTELRSLAPSAAAATRFFKTGPGQYAEGDTFIGVAVPVLRAVARAFRALPLDEVRALLKSPFHEERRLALTVLVLQVAKDDAAHRGRVYDLHLGDTSYINNWDLVNCSAPPVVGGFLLTRPRTPLMTLARSVRMWERRIAVVATQHFIRHGEFDDTLAVSRMLLEDGEDLIHKATGWMLREVGKNSRLALEGFLDRHAAVMPRTMLRYAVARLPADRRRAYLRTKSDSVGGAADGV